MRIAGVSSGSFRSLIVMALLVATSCSAESQATAAKIKYEQLTIPGCSSPLTGISADGKPVGYGAAQVEGRTIVVQFGEDGKPATWYEFVHPGNSLPTGEIEVGARDAAGKRTGSWWSCRPGVELRSTEYSEGKVIGEVQRFAANVDERNKKSDDFKPSSISLEGPSTHTGQFSNGQNMWDGYRGIFVPSVLIIGRHEKSRYYVGDAITINPLPTSGGVIVSISPRNEMDIEQGKGWLIHVGQFVGQGKFRGGFPEGSWVQRSEKATLESELANSLVPIGEFRMEYLDGTIVTGARDSSGSGKVVSKLRIQHPDGRIEER